MYYVGCSFINQSPMYRDLESRRQDQIPSQTSTLKSGSRSVPHAWMHHSLDSFTGKRV